MLARTDRCVMRRRQGRDAVRAMDGYRAVAGRGRRSDVVHGLSVGLTACGQRARLSHVPDAEAGVLRCLTALGCPRADLVDERGCVVESRVSDRLALLQTGSDVKWALTKRCLWASGLRRWVIRQPDVGACGRTLARRGWDVKVAAAAGGDSRPALGTADGVRRGMEHYRGQCCNGVSGRRCGRFPVTARSPRRPAAGAGCYACPGGGRAQWKVRRIRRLPV